MWTALYKETKEAVLDFLFPSLCLYCQQNTMQSRKLLCSSCSDLLTLIDMQGRCLRCFCPSEQAECPPCSKDSSFLSKRAYTCERYGPVRALLSQSTSSFGAEIARSMGSLMTVQLCRLPWLLPDILMPMPGARDVAEQMASFLQVAAEDVLSRREFSFAEEGLIGQSAFHWKKRLFISDKIVLLVAVSIPTEEEIKKVCHLLYQGDPKEIYLLAFTSE